MVGLGETYFPAFALALGASAFEAGLLTTAPLLIGAVFQLIAPYAARRIGNKRWVVASAVLQSLTFVPIALAARMEGTAYGWLLLLRGALADAPDVAASTVVEASIPLDALAAAAERQPLLLFNGGPQAPWSPPHVRAYADEFVRAAAGARALASAARKPPG